MKPIIYFGTIISLFASQLSGAPCPRFAVGSVVSQPEDLYSKNGILAVNLNYQTSVDPSGNALYCFVNAADGAQSPTLHVNPGDQLIVNLKNMVPSSMPSMPDMEISPPFCGASFMTATSVNIHYHGTNVPPTCGQDEVIKTTINSGESFTYHVHFPVDEPPGLYWYHPHIHGISEPAVQGGASGAIVVEGIQNVNSTVAKLPQQILMVRDNLVPGNPTPGGSIPSWDVSLNYIPIPYPAFTPAVIRMKPSERQLFRLVNASADTILHLQLVYDGVAQPLAVVALDGVPTGSQDGNSIGKTINYNDILVPPAGRVEFTVTGPALTVKTAILQTLNIDTGPDGDNDPTRPLADIKVSADASEPPVTLGPAGPQVTSPGMFAGLADLVPTVERNLYFSEVLSDPSNPNSPTNFYITVAGKTPVLFSPDNPPAIITNQGSVEDWTIQNQAQELHEFHIHQIHFLVLEVNGVPVEDGQYYDTYQVPYWSGKGPYPSIKVRMDFRGPITGDFVYHCHILGHEDSGMMAIIRILPATTVH